MRTNVKKRLVKAFLIIFTACIFALLSISFATKNVSASQDAVFEMIDGAYIYQVDQEFEDKTAIRFSAMVTDSWVQENLTGEEGVDYRFYSKVTANGKTLYKSWATDFDENGVYYRNIDLANFPSEDIISDIYSHEFTVSAGVATLEDLEDEIVDQPIAEVESVTRTMEYVAALASANGNEGVSKYIGGGSAFVNDKDNVLEVSGVNNSPNNLLEFAGYTNSAVKSLYVNGVKQNSVKGLTATDAGIEVAIDNYTFGNEYSFVMITEAGDALIADRVTFADFAISDIASYLEWYNVGESVNVEYYVALADNVYLTENERLAKAPSKYLGNGTMNGRGYVLDGLRLSYTGLWRDIGDFTFKNIALTNIHHDNAAGSSWASLFSYNDAVSLKFDNVWLSYLNQTTSASKYVGFTAYTTSSKDTNVHFYNSVIVSDQPNTTATIFKNGAVGTLSNTKVISLNNRKVTTNVSADYTSMEAYYSDNTMSTTGYDMNYWTVINGVLMFKSLISSDIALEASTIGKNLLEDTVTVSIDEKYEVKEVTLDGVVVDYTLNGSELVVAGFADKALGEYVLRIVVSEGEYEYTFAKKVSVINDKTAEDYHYNGYLVLNGVSKHTLVIPSSTDTYSSKAITDFTSLFSEATGITLSTTTDKSSISYTESSRYIVLGGSYIYTAAGLTVDSSVEQDGYQIVTKGQSIFILGTTTRGKLFGAYELLAKLFNYERLAPDTYVIDEEVKYVSLPDYDFIDNPDAELRIGGWGSVYLNSKESAALTMRFDMNYNDLWIEDTLYNANWTHNIAEIMDYAGHIPTDRSQIVDNFGNKFNVDTTVSGWYENYTMTYSYKDPLNKSGTRYGYDVNGDYRKSYGFKVGWFSVAATSSQMSTYGDPLAVTGNDNDNNPIINKTVQLCYSGGTYPTDTKHEVWQEMVEFGAQRVANIINAYTGKNKIFQITAEDNAGYCQCRACRAWYDYYSQGNLYLNEYINTYKVVMSKGLMGLQLRFVNALARYITEHDLLDEDKKDVKIACFCYSNYTDSPCVENADGTFSPIDNAVVCPDNVLIYYAPSMDYTKNLTDATSETNVKMLKILKANSGICNHIGAWLYQMSDYDDYFLPSNNYYAYSDIYETLIDMGAKWIFHQGAQKSTTRNTAFAQLKMYLNSKLSWDVSLDEKELIDKFFDGYYGPASETMRTFFEEVYDVADANGGKTTLSKSVFSQDDLERWISLCEQALTEVASLKTADSARYNQLVLNIKCEMMMPRYLLIRLYSIYQGKTITDLSSVKTQFVAECKAAGVLQGTNQDVIANVTLTPVG